MSVVEGTDSRRRIDRIRDPAFLVDLESIDMDQLRDRRRMCDELENELSYYRRLLHGRMDLLAFELRRRSGEETRTLMEALPEILTDGPPIGDPHGRPPRIDVPDLPEDRRRRIDTVLDDNFLGRLVTIDEDELQKLQATLVEIEADISTQRSDSQHAFDAIQAELTRRYREGLGGFDELLGRA
ncbi:MAG: hypothetical protein KJO36_02335 [Acidimicrobiia bacterium]|nr:hypothetical protein [Acidimicrobiia bacterium]NND12360.1 hypothetical protein [Acidimicrobiia bacterium]NNL48896.1 hypothetical protein [Acidimicrobiia bacterium]